MEVVKRIHSGHYRNCFDIWCISSVIELLAVHFSQWSFHISFPELTLIPIVKLKKFKERSTMESLKRVVKRFIEQVELNIEFMQMKIEMKLLFFPKRSTVDRNVSSAKQDCSVYTIL
ncbi:hypothetical protein YC2023_117896 [Brassica napus]